MKLLSGSYIILSAVMVLITAPLPSSATPEVVVAIQRLFRRGIYGIGAFGGTVGRISKEEAERIRIGSGRLDEGDRIDQAAKELEETTTSYVTVVVTVTQTLDRPAPTPTLV